MGDETRLDCLPRSHAFIDAGARTSAPAHWRPFRGAGNEAINEILTARDRAEIAGIDALMSVAAGRDHLEQ